MKNCLIMLTADYPFTVGEPFLESEMPYHSGNYDKIIILTLEKAPGAELTRKLPDNAEAYNVSTGNPKISRAVSAAEGIASAVFHKTELPESDKERIGGSFAKRAFTEYFEKRSLNKFKDCKKILDKIDFTLYDTVTVYSYWFFITCRVGVYVKNYLKEKGVNSFLVSRAHRYDIYESANSLNYLPCRELLASETEKVFVCSSDGYEHFKALLPSFANRFKTAYLGTVDNGTGSYTNTFHLLTCSRTVPVKRLDKLIDALALLKDSGAELYWTHIGDGSEQEKIKSLAQEKLNFMNFEFLGQMKNSEVCSYYKNHPVNLFVNISSSEGLPVSIMEAASFGTPVLATDVGGTREIVVDGYNGCLIDSGFETKELAEKISEFYNMSPEKNKEMRKNAREFWERNFNCDKNYSDFAAELVSLAETVNK